MESPQAALDQENTRLAIDEFNRFVENYPNHALVANAQSKIEELREKLAYKEYLAAQLYFKMKYWDAAIIYYQSIINEYPRSVWVDDSQFGAGLAYKKKKEYSKATEIFTKLVAEGKTDPGIKKKAARELSEIQKYEAKKREKEKK